MLVSTALFWQLASQQVVLGLDEVVTIMVFVMAISMAFTMVVIEAQCSGHDDQQNSIQDVQLDDHHGADQKDNQSDFTEFASFDVALIVIFSLPHTGRRLSLLPYYLYDHDLYEIFMKIKMIL